MQLRVNAIIAYKKGGWSSYTSVYDETTRTVSQEFPSKDSVEGNEFLSWPGVKEKLSIVSLPTETDVSHISDITYNISSIGDTKTDIYSANEDVVVGSLGDGTKHDDLVDYVEQHHLTNSLKDLDSLFFCWDFSGPDGPLVPLDNDDENYYTIPNHSRTGIKEINNRNGFLSAVNVTKVNNKLRFGSDGWSEIAAPFSAKQINLRKWWFGGIAKGVGFTARIDVLATDGNVIEIGIKWNGVNYPMYVKLNHDADTLDCHYSSAAIGGSYSGTDIAIPGGFPSTYRLNMVWAFDGNLTIAVDDTIIYTNNPGGCWVALNTAVHWCVEADDGESIDLDQVMLVDTDSVTELNSLAECPTKCPWRTHLSVDMQPQCVEYGPLTPPVPKMQLTISGLSEGFTFLGLGNGVHQVAPGGMEYSSYESWIVTLADTVGGTDTLAFAVSDWDPEPYSSWFTLSASHLGTVSAVYGTDEASFGDYSLFVNVDTTDFGVTGSNIQSYNIPRVSEATPRIYDGTFKTFGSVTFANGVTISWQKGTDWYI